ncbi:hypothetical protein HY495_00785 [Candidatus Woesearchaeota archaeon]|nr:hypothetical protein [Candidatus Woesearchaeota archaeon]
MNKRLILLPILIFSLFLLTSCGGSEQQTQTTGVFIGGTQGVVAEFEPFGVEEAGVSSIFDTETFPVEITIRNKGEYEIQKDDVTITLTGLSKEEFEGIPSWALKNTGSIETISDLLPTGGEETISFSSDAKMKSKVVGLLDRTWFANVQFKYQTQVIVPEICLKEDLTDKRVCEVQGTKKFFASAAPVTVTAVSEEPAGKGIVALKFTVENKGTGDVATPTGDFGLTNKLGFSIDDPAWECKSGGKVDEARLVNGKVDVVCKLKQALAAKTLEVRQVKLTLDYKYQDLIQEKLRVKESAK